jgi:16S rRNA U516 pseudouridylate synthase RsuA-like enzyme
MIKRAVIRAPARGYVDGRFIGEEKEPSDAGANSRGKGRGKAGAGRRGKVHTDSVLSGDNIGNTTAKRRSRGGVGSGKARTAGGGTAGGAGNRTRGAGAAAAGQGARVDGRKRPQGQGAGQGQRQGQGQSQGQGRDPSRARGRGQGQRGPGPTAGLGATPFGTSPFISDQDTAPRGAGRTKQRRGSTGKKSPFRTGSAITAANAFAQEFSPTQGSDLRRLGDEAKSGQFAEALAASANVKRERLHKVLAQSGHGSRRDMEIMISSGRVMVNGIVATTGTQVAPGDNVLIDQRHVKLKFTEDMPRILLYHKPEGEIVTTNDPGNRITVFDNLPRVETGKWVAVGRLDINTSGLLIFTTSGELANRFMHPRYEVEREYAVRILGELTEEQTKQLLTGVKIEESSKGNNKNAEDDDDRFNRIDADDEDDIIDDDIYDIDEEEDAAPSLANAIAPAPARTPAPANEHADGHGNVQSVEEDEDRQPFNIQPLHHQPLDDQAHDDQPLENHPFENQPIDARFLGNASPAPAAFARNELAKFDVIEKRGGEGVNQWYHVVIREGRNREVRKMFESLGLTVSRLIRTRFGKVELPPRLLRGKMIELDENQVRSVLASAGMKVEGPVAPLLSRGKNAGPRVPGAQREARGGRDGRNGREGGEARPPREQNRQRDPNRSRHQNPRTNADGTIIIIGAENTGIRGPNNRNRRNGRGGERNKIPRDAASGEIGSVDSGAFIPNDTMGSGNIDTPLNAAGQPAIDNNANRNRGRGNSRGGRGRRSSGPRRDSALNPGRLDTASAVEASGNRVEGGEAGADQANANANSTPRTDNRPRGKSRRTFRGRRNTRDAANAVVAGGNDGGSGGNDGSGNTGGGTE